MVLESTPLNWLEYILKGSIDSLLALSKKFMDNFQSEWPCLFNRHDLQNYK
jgi:hypothetical protein